MAKPFSALPGSMKDLNERIQRGFTNIMQQTAIGIGATMVDTTRVDTGEARSNWRASLGAPLGGTIPPYSPGNKLGQGETANANAAKAQQRQAIARYNARKNTVIFFTNNVRHIGALNDGDGNLAPGQMVEQGLQTGRAILATLKLRV